MPKATIDENCDALGTKSEIGFPRKFEMSPPTGDSSLSEYSEKELFGRLISLGSDTRHVVGTLLARKPVGHHFALFREFLASTGYCKECDLRPLRKCELTF